MDEELDRSSSQSDEVASGGSTGSALSTYLRAIKRNQDESSFNRTLAKKNSFQESDVVSSSSVRNIQEMFSSLTTTSPAAKVGLKGRQREEGASEDYRRTFVHAKFSNRLTQKISMDEEIKDSNLRRFGSATQIVPAKIGAHPMNYSTLELSKSNGADLRKPLFRKNPNLPIGSHARNVLRLEHSEPEDSDDDSPHSFPIKFSSDHIGSNSSTVPSTSSTPSSFTSGLTSRSNVKDSVLSNNGPTSASSHGTLSTPTSSVTSSRSNSEDLSSSRKFSAGDSRLTATPAAKASPEPEIRARAAETAPKFPELPVAITTKPRQLDGYVGFANLPNQVYRKAVNRGFEFTLMVVGESGLGKSTLINSMFLTDIYSPENPGPSARIKQTLSVETNKVLLKESGVNLTLTIVDTPGFGDQVDNSKCWEPVINFVESRFEEFLDAETRVNRVPLPDTRVHACLYFIAPTGHGLKKLDIEFMRRLHDKVNIIPVIAKADCFTQEEIAYFKEQIMRQISQAGIKLYDFPDESSVVYEEKDKKEIRSMKSRVPFAVAGSNYLIENADGKRIRARKYPWGVFNIEDTAHCDFIPLRNMLIRTYLQDLKEVTNNVLYENYRCKKLAGVAGTTMDKIPNKNPLATIEEERKEHQAKMAKMEKEMEEVFERKVREKMNKLQESENDLEKRHRESKEKLEAQKRELEAKRAAFLEEKSAWEAMNGVTIDDLKRMSMESLDGKKKKGGALSGVSFRMGR